MELPVLNKLMQILAGIALFSGVSFIDSASANSLDDYLALLQKEKKNHPLQIDYDRSACETYLNPFGKYKDGIVETTVLVGDLGVKPGTACRGFLSLDKVRMNCNSGKLVKIFDESAEYSDGISKLAAFALCLPKEILSQSGKLEEADNLMRSFSEAIYNGTVEEKQNALEKLKIVQEIYGKLGDVGWRKGRNLAYLCDGYLLLGDWGNAQSFCQLLGDWGKKSAITKHMTAKSLLMLASAYLGGGKLNETVKTLEQIRSLDVKSECNRNEYKEDKFPECNFEIPLLTNISDNSSSDIDPRLLVAIGETYFYFGEYKKAIEYYNKVKNTFPEDKQPYFFAEDCDGEGSYPKRKVYPKIVLAMLRDGNLPEALKDLNEVCLGKIPRKYLEELYIAQGKYKEAFDDSEIGIGGADFMNTNFFKSGTFLSETNSQKALRIARNTNSTLILYSYVRDFPPQGLVRDLSIFTDRKLFIYVVKPTGSIEARTVDIQKFSAEVAKQVPIPVSQGNNLVASIVLIAIAGGIAFLNRETKKVLITTGVTTVGLLSVLAVISGRPQFRSDVTTKNLSLTSLLRSGQISIQDDKNPSTSGLEDIFGCSQNDECLTYLYQFLIQAVNDLLPKPNEKIIFFPDKDIFTIPFAALKNSSGKYLIQNYSISVAPSIDLLDELYHYSNSIWRPATESALVVGNPVIPPVKVSWEGTPISLPPLPAAEFEAKEVSKLLNVTPLIGKEATKKTVIQHLKSARILHFATHGYLNARVNRELKYRELCYDGFGFYRECSVYDEGQGALAFTASDGDDGILSEVDLSDQRVAAELTVLSACNTSLNVKSFYGGATGMASPFLTAGVPSVLASLWSIPDAPTAELMIEFYKNLNNNPDRSQALRLAQLTIMKKYPDPSNWAGFQLIGLSKNPPNAKVSTEQVFESVAETVKVYLDYRNGGYLPFVLRTVTEKHRNELEKMFGGWISYEAHIPGLEREIKDFRFDLIPSSLKLNDFDNAEVDVAIYSKKYHIVLKGSGSGWLVDSISNGIGVENATPNVSNQCKTATLVARDANTQINIREGAGQQYTAPSYGLPGDVVNLLGNQNDTQGSIWYQVEFPKSKVKGWVRGDFVKTNCQ